METTDSCAALTGTYADTGERVIDDEEPGRSKPGLRWYLFETAHSSGELDRIEMTFGADRVLRARGVRDGEVLAEAEYAETAGVLDCRDDAVEIDFSHPLSGFSNPVFMGHQSDSALFMKATDGALIVKLSRDRAGLGLFFLPHFYSSHAWYRFPELKEGE